MLLKLVNDFIYYLLLQKVQENFEIQHTFHVSLNIPIIVSLPDGSRIQQSVPVATNQIKSSHVTSTPDLDGVKMYGS